MNVAIIDDDKSCANELEKLILSYDCNTCIDVFCDGQTFLNSNINEYHIIFLDIEMSNLDGIRIGKIIREKGFSSTIFYVTNHTSFISDALRNSPFQYLIKPINAVIFLKVYENAVQKIVMSLENIAIKWKNDISNIPIFSITYIEHHSRKLYFYTNCEKQYISNGKINNIYRKLLDYDFVQCHKSFIINMKYIIEIKKDNVIMVGEKSIPLSKLYSRVVKKKYNLFLAGIAL